MRIDWHDVNDFLPTDRTKVVVKNVHSNWKYMDCLFVEGVGFVIRNDPSLGSDAGYKQPHPQKPTGQ